MLVMNNETYQYYMLLSVKGKSRFDNGVFNKDQKNVILEIWPMYKNITPQPAVHTQIKCL